MGTIIKATGINTDQTVVSSIEKATLAGRDCLKNAAIDPQEVDILINVGLFRDKNMCEPAMAALIQKGLGINLDYVKYPVKTPAFSFDLMEGVCGFIKAIQVADSFLRAGRAKYVLIVSSNAHPSNKPTADFPYSNVGAAMLIGQDDKTEAGFVQYSFGSTSVEERYGSVAYLDLATCGANGRNLVDVIHDDDYVGKLFAFTAEFTAEFIKERKVSLEKTLLLASAPRAGFTEDLGQALSLITRPDLDLFSQYGDAHTSCLPLGFHLLNATNKQADYQQVLFVNCGTGLSVGCALYKM